MTDSVNVANSMLQATGVQLAISPTGGSESNDNDMDFEDIAEFFNQYACNPLPPTISTRTMVLSLQAAVGLMLGGSPEALAEGFREGHKKGHRD
ncbi:MAG: hypothetical protein ACYDGR_04525 [Candidatus Dormibacteria bacterium]